MSHFGMSKEEIDHSSLAFIFAIQRTTGKRLCEKLGIPYGDEAEEEFSQEEIDSDDNSYPLLKTPNLEHYGNKNSKGRKGTSKEDIIRIWSDIADIQDNT